MIPMSVSSTYVHLVIPARPARPARSTLLNFIILYLQVASTAHYYAPKDWKLEMIESLNAPFGKKVESFKAQFNRYALSKLCNVLFNAELQRVVDDIEGTEISCVAIHPGTVATGRYIPFLSTFGTNSFWKYP